MSMSNEQEIFFIWEHEINLNTKPKTFLSNADGKHFFKAF